MFLLNLLRGFLSLPLLVVHGNPFQLVPAAVDLRDGLQDGIGVLRRHGVELTNPLLPVEVLDGAEVGIQLVDDAVDFQIRKPGVDLIGRIDAERKGNTLAPVELLQPFVNIVRLPDLHIFREGRVGKYVYDAGFVYIS